MRRFVAMLAALSVALIAAAGPAAADVQKLVIKDPGWVSNLCVAGDPCTRVEGDSAIIELVIKCPVGEQYTLFVTVKQDGGETQGTTQNGGDCTGDGARRFVIVSPQSGAFHPGPAKVKASAFSDPGTSQNSEGVFDVNVDRKITLVEGQPTI